jgi:uncharacterized protein (DUF2164 family)
MTIPPEARREAVSAIQAWFRDERDETVGELQAGFLLDAVLEAAGPAVYDRAVRDAQARLRAVVDDLDVTLAGRR